MRDLPELTGTVARRRGPVLASPPRSPIEDAELVGAWGLSVTWNDGHSTGIYSWDALRRWCDATSGPFEEATMGRPGGLVTDLPEAFDG